MPCGTTKSLGAVLATVVLCALTAACSSGSEPGPTCTAVGGDWNVDVDYGNGLISHQNWTISQAACDLVITTDLPDTYGPGLPASTAGYAGIDSFGASWENTYDACRYASRLNATVSGSTLTGTIDWGRGGYGNGWCSGALGQLVVSGTR